MKIASNKIADVVRFFRDELKDIYEKDEVETFIVYCFEEYLNIKRAEIGLRSNETMSESELLKFNFAIKDLKQYKPIQYIFGKADFYGLKFIVNEHVLIPRPETEELVHLIIKDIHYSNLNTQISILDIGTGSGCIPVALKKNISSAKISAIDISEQALVVAKQNAKLNNAEIEFINDTILNPMSKIRDTEAQFDIIVSNPPYICISEKEQMQKNVVDYEPHLALFIDDQDPLLFYKMIADFTLKHLRSDGKLYVEINPVYGSEIKQMLENKRFKNVILLKDLNNKNRILRCTI
jgi:release factor glutamine methyltransferase